MLSHRQHPLEYDRGQAFMRAPIDLAEEGTKNVGATNVWYLAGPIAGCIAAVGDAVKGGLAVLVAKLAGLPSFFWPLCGWMAVIGHTWSIFLNFRGGRGASATAGVFVVMMPWEAMATGLLSDGLAYLWRLFAFLACFDVALSDPNLPCQEPSTLKRPALWPSWPFGCSPLGGVGCAMILIVL